MNDPFLPQPPQTSSLNQLKACGHNSQTVLGVVDWHNIVQCPWCLGPRVGYQLTTLIHMDTMIHRKTITKNLFFILPRCSTLRDGWLCGFLQRAAWGNKSLLSTDHAGPQGYNPMGKGRNCTWA